MGNVTCRGPECTSAAIVRGLCRAHYEQLRRGYKELTVLGTRYGRPRRIFLDEQGRKLCTKCLQWKLTTQFHVVKRSMVGFASACKSCSAVVISAARRNHRYGLTPEAFEAMLASQGGCCAVCPETAPSVWHVDHDHSCCPTDRTCGGCVRGILCVRCNMALGLIDDDTSRLLKMVEYLSR